MIPKGSKMDALLTSTMPSTLYFPKITADDAVQILIARPCGHFIVRDSSHDRALYAISVRTERSVLHVRVFQHSKSHQYYICTPKSERKYFDSLNDLLRFYMEYPANVVVDEKKTKIRQHSFTLSSRIWNT